MLKNCLTRFIAMTVCSSLLSLVKSQLDTVHLKYVIPCAAGATSGFCYRLIDLKIHKSQWKDSF